MQVAGRADNEQPLQLLPAGAVQRSQHGRKNRFVAFRCLNILKAFGKQGGGKEVVFGRALQGDDSVDESFLESFCGDSGDDAAPLGTFDRLFQLGGEPFSGDAETHFDRVIEGALPPEEFLFFLPEPAISEDAALQAFGNRPFTVRT